MAIYRPATCAYCEAKTWCELRARGAYQCRACKVERFFELVLYPPLGYKLQDWQRQTLRDLYGTLNMATGRRRYRRAFISVGKQNGKALAVTTPIPTPAGWSTMLDIKVGDVVFDDNGKPCRVVSQTGVMIGRPCYELEFSDGCKITADAEHEWWTRSRTSHGKFGLRTTKEINERARLEYSGSAGANHSVQVAGSIQCRKCELPVPPYVLGAWLGDGTGIFSTMTVDLSDLQILDEIVKEGVCWHRFKSGKSKADNVMSVRLGGEIGKGSGKRNGNSLQTTLRKNGLLGNKHIPPSYLRSSKRQRMDLLQGLMDTDGSCSEAGQCEFSNCNLRLGFGVLELLRSLGFKPTYSISPAKLEGITVGWRMRIQFWSIRSQPVFRLSRKVVRLPLKIHSGKSKFRQIISVTPVESVPVKCIQVDSESHLYLAGESMIPTHNSFMIGGLPIYHIMMENELQPEAFGVASARDQAGIVFNAAKLLVEKNPYLKKYLKVLDSTKRIIRRDGQGLYAVLAADGATQDGKRGSLLLIDELHRFKRKSAEEVYSVLTKGTISRKEPLTISITTSGDEFESPLWFSEYTEAKKLIDGSLESEVLYAKIWQADPERVASEPEYWKSREARVAANPSHEDNGGFLPDERIVDLMNEAIAKPEKFTEYIRLNLNVPIAQSETPAIKMPLWYEGGGGIDLRTWQNYDIELLIRKWDLIEKPCVIGIDLAWTTDFSSMAVVFPPSGDFDASNLEQWKVIVFFWMPADRVADIERRIRQPLKDWVRRGFMTTVPGAEMDLAVVESKIKWAVEMFDVRELAFDKWGGMRSLAMKLNADEGMTTVDVRQGFATISGPTKDFLAMHQSVRLAHGNNPILNWNASCLALLSDGNDNVRPNKPDRAASSKRIDGVVATITALARATLLYQPPSVYASRGPLTIED